jgi:hypothetical protein
MRLEPTSSATRRALLHAVTALVQGPLALRAAQAFDNRLPKDELEVRPQKPHGLAPHGTMFLLVCGKPQTRLLACAAQIQNSQDSWSAPE